MAADAFRASDKISPIRKIQVTIISCAFLMSAITGIYFFPFAPYPMYSGIIREQDLMHAQLWLIPKSDDDKKLFPAATLGYSATRTLSLWLLKTPEAQRRTILESILVRYNSENSPVQIQRAHLEIRRWKIDTLLRSNKSLPAADHLLIRQYSAGAQK